MGNYSLISFLLARKTQSNEVRETEKDRNVDRKKTSNKYRHFNIICLVFASNDRSKLSLVRVHKQTRISTCACFWGATLLSTLCASVIDFYLLYKQFFFFVLFWLLLLFSGSFYMNMWNTLNFYLPIQASCIRLKKLPRHTFNTNNILICDVHIS